MAQQPCNKKSSPPFYTTNTQGNSSFFSETASSITECSISPSKSASARAYPSFDSRSLNDPSPINEQASLLGTANSKPPGYQTVPQGLSPKDENVPPAPDAFVTAITFAVSMVVLLIIFGLSQSGWDPTSQADLRWEDLHPAETCLRHGTRVYTARLPYISRWYDRMSMCHENKADIHGRLMKPDYCEDKGSDGIWGKWIVDHEPSCTTWWSNLSDKGCTAPGSGLRRFEQSLENIPRGSDWKEMCTTAPTDFHGHHFDSPTSCADWGRNGIFGYWEIKDPSC